MRGAPPEQAGDAHDHAGHDHPVHHHAPHGLHAHHEGDHDRAHAAPRRGAGRLGLSLLLVLSFGLLEAIVGWMSGSLALMSDAAHMSADGMALALAWIAQRVAARPATARYSFGFERGETLAAFVNALALVVLMGWLAVEAVARFFKPQEIDALPALIVACIGLVVNLVLIFLLRGEAHGHDHGHAHGHDAQLNVRAAFLHVLGDLAASVAAVIAMLWSWRGGGPWLDAAMALAISLMMLPATFTILRESVPVLMDAVPRGIDFHAVGGTLAAVPGVRAVHDLHIWQMTPGQVALSAHLEVERLSDWEGVLADCREALSQAHGITHLTLQPEPAAARHRAAHERPAEGGSL